MSAKFHKVRSRQNLFRFIGVAVFVSLVLLCASYHRRTDLPGYGGKNIAQWFDREVLEDHPVCGLAPRRIESRTAILRMGENAIPFLIEKAQEKPSRAGELYDGMVCRLPLWLMQRVRISDNYRIPMERSTAI